MLVQIEQPDTHAGQVLRSDGDAVQAAEAGGVRIAGMVKARGRADGTDAIAQCFLSGGQQAGRGVWQAVRNSTGAIAEAVADFAVEQGINEGRVVRQLDLIAAQRVEAADVERDAELLPAFDNQRRLAC